MFSRLATRTAVQARAVTQVARLTVPTARLLTTSSARASSERMRAAQAAYRALEKKQREVEALRPPPRSTRGPVAAQEPEAQEEEDEAYPEDEMYDDEYDDDEGYPGEGYPGEQPIAAVTRPAPEWTATALMPAVEGAAPEFKQLSSNDFLGKWQVLFFYPLDFTFVCPTEIRAFSDRFAEFEKLGASVIACSVDSEFSHLAWTQMAKTAGGLGPMKIPILSDITKSISRSYGVLLEEKGIALRGLFIIDPEGILRQATVNDLPIGRSVDETLRLLQAFQYHAEHGEVCPAGWAPGKEAMQANPAGLKKYFERK